MRLGDAGADLVGEGKSAAPRLRNHLPAQGLKKWLRIVVGDGQHGNLGNGLDVGQRNQLRPGHRADAGRLRVARI